IRVAVRRLLTGVQSQEHRTVPSGWLRGARSNCACRPMNDDGEPDDQKGHVRFEVAGAGIRLALSAVGVRKPSSEMDRTERPLSETQALRQPSTLPMWTWCRCNRRSGASWCLTPR